MRAARISATSRGKVVFVVGIVSLDSTMRRDVADTDVIRLGGVAYRFYTTPWIPPMTITAPTRSSIRWYHDTHHLFAGLISLFAAWPSARDDLVDGNDPRKEPLHICWE
jgi:hypothetical protein